MNINKRKVIPTLAFIGLTLGGTALAAEAKKPREELSIYQRHTLKTAHKLHQSGEHEKAMELMESADITWRDQKDADEHKLRKKMFESKIEQNDFDLFKEMVAETPMADIVNTQEKFDALVESHLLRQEGKEDEAREVLEHTGIRPFGRTLKTH